MLARHWGPHVVPAGGDTVGGGVVVGGVTQPGVGIPGIAAVGEATIGQVLGISIGGSLAIVVSVGSQNSLGGGVQALGQRVQATAGTEGNSGGKAQSGAVREGSSKPGVSGVRVGSSKVLSLG